MAKARIIQSALFGLGVLSWVIAWEVWFPKRTVYQFPTHRASVSKRSPACFLVGAYRQDDHIHFSELSCADSSGAVTTSTLK